MKKILAVLLSLLMVFNVTAFAITLETPVEEKEELLELPMLVLDEGVSTFATGEGGTFYVMLDPAKDYKKIKITDEGCVNAKMFKYDPEMHVPLEGVFYCVKNGNEVVVNGLEYEVAKEKATELNEAEKTTQYKIVLDECYVNVIEIEVEDNYTAAYKEGKIKITAEVDEKEVSAVIKVVSDVFVYDIENVKWASANEEILDETFEGTSNYDKKTEGVPTVISKTAFRHIKGQDLIVQNGGIELLIEDVNATQPGLNLKGFIKVQQEDEENERELAFGFYGNKQKVCSDFVITVDLDMSYFELREFFGVKLEEEDLVTYTLYKNGEPIYEFAVDYMKVDHNKDVELEISCNAGEEIGSYYITVGTYDVVEPEDEVIEEENPNTGAPVFFS